MKFALIAWFALTLTAHEVDDNRANLILRDKTHVSLTLFLDFTTVLHQALAPQRTYSAFLVVASAMKPEDFAKDLQRAQAKLQAATHLYGPAGELPLTHWTWPDAKQVQAQFQQLVMQAMVDPAAHTHQPPLEVHAEAVSVQEIGGVKIQFPEEFQKVLVVAYKPTQVWLERKAVSPQIRF